MWHGIHAITNYRKTTPACHGDASIPDALNNFCTVWLSEWCVGEEVEPHPWTFCRRDLRQFGSVTASQHHYSTFFKNITHFGMNLGHHGIIWQQIFIKNVLVCFSIHPLIIWSVTVAYCCWNTEKQTPSCSHLQNSLLMQTEQLSAGWFNCLGFGQMYNCQILIHSSFPGPHCELFFFFKS